MHTRSNWVHQPRSTRAATPTQHHSTQHQTQHRFALTFCFVSPCDAMDLPLPAEVSQQLAVFQHTLEILQDAIRPCVQTFNTTSPLERAEQHVTLAEAIKVAFDLYLRTQGCDPEEHSISKEEERIKRYIRKLSKVQSETILKTTKRKTEVNMQAANRFITAAIPELSAEQKTALKQAGVKQKASLLASDRSKHVSASDEALNFLQQAMAETRPNAE